MLYISTSVPVTNLSDWAAASTGHGMSHTCLWPFLWPAEEKTNFPNLKTFTSCFCAPEHAYKWSLRALPVILCGMSFTGLLG